MSSDLYQGQRTITEDGYIARFWRDVFKAISDVERYRRRIGCR